MVPHAAESSRRLDKTAVLRFATHGLRLQYVFGKSASRRRRKPSFDRHPPSPFISDEYFTNENITHTHSHFGALFQSNFQLEIAQITLSAIEVQLTCTYLVLFFLSHSLHRPLLFGASSAHCELALQVCASPRLYA